ncbi:MAG: DNA topoisomerase III, partial [Kiritimatiellaceae bacterium]|nr:DNA topoisomerase III [Kiritimatiellaceae bacterium]
PRAEQIAALNLAKLPFTNRIIDDKKVTDHHALIPTGVEPRNLGATEQVVYDAITTQFIAAFYPVCRKMLTTVDGVSVSVPFQAKGTQVISPGWTILFPKKKKAPDDEEDVQALPVYTQGETGPHEPSLREGKTNPPKHFTENSLLGAMEAAGKLVEDDALREALKERGIGTPATRAAIIETLIARNYIQREKKLLLCTDMGRCLIALIRDPLLKSPEMTGEWEGKLKQIERNELPASEFMNGICGYIRGLIHSNAQTRTPVRFGHCPLCGSEVIQGKSALGCSGWKAGCSFVLSPVYKGITLTTSQIQTLLQHRILPYAVQLDGEPRLLILSTQGQVMDLRVPSAEGQKKDGKPDRPARKP